MMRRIDELALKKQNIANRLREWGLDNMDIDMILRLIDVDEVERILNEFESLLRSGELLKRVEKWLSYSVEFEDIEGRFKYDITTEMLSINVYTKINYKKVRKILTYLIIRKYIKHYIWGYIRIYKSYYDSLKEKYTEEFAEKRSRELARGLALADHFSDARKDAIKELLRREREAMEKILDDLYREAEKFLQELQV